jgi:hypothetical protein
MLPWPVKKNWDQTETVLEGYKYDSVVSVAGLATAQKWRRAARKLYRDFCRKNGVEQETSKQPATAAKSYAKGWSQQIRLRLRADEASNLNDYQGTGMEVALRDIRDVVKRAVEDIYPRPVVKPLTPEQEEQLKKQRNRPLPKLREQPFDPASYQRGANDAKTVDLSGHPHKRVENKPQELEA